VPANALSIAGSDPSGGAGVQADLKTFAALGCHGMAVVAALTAQNSLGVRATHVPPASFLAAQIDAVFDDVRVDALKIGMLGSADNVRAVAGALSRRRPSFAVLDPVLAASSGDGLAGADMPTALRELYPLVDLVTPNAPEAAALTGLDPALDLDGSRRLGRAMLAMGARAVLMKGGHIPGDMAVDLLIDPAGERVFSSPRLATRHTRGTGCALSSAIAAFVARGEALDAAIAAAKEFLVGAMQGAAGFDAGGGPGPLNHFWRLWPER
jgi:hydroxymethylpyrimidine kinase/phosphomethylpyrimidine kinase